MYPTVIDGGWKASASGAPMMLPEKRDRQWVKVTAPRQDRISNLLTANGALLSASAVSEIKSRTTRWRRNKGRVARDPIARAPPPPPPEKRPSVALVVAVVLTTFLKSQAHHVT
jgi:hypothetical protein